MSTHDIAVSGLNGAALDGAIRAIVAAAPADAVLRIRITGALDAEHLRVLRASHVRAITPDMMNVEIRAGGGRPFGRPPGRGRDRRRAVEAPATGGSGEQLDLGMAI
jgi:hypothetical protein